MADETKVYIADLKDNVEKLVTLCGWLYQSRAGGKVLFLIVRDGTGHCQCIVEKGKVPDELFDKLRHLGQESSLTVTGMVRADERSVGGHELAVTDAKILCAVSDYPITPKAHGIDFLLKNRHLHLRSQRQWCIGRVRHTVIDAIRRFFNDNGFILIDTPIFTTIAGEGEQTLFGVDYFDRQLHLTQTGQLYLEAAAMSFGKVYCFGPTFRAEKSKTRRHLTEFWMVEPEVAYIDINGLLELAENFVSFIAAEVLRINRSELEVLGADIESLGKLQPPFYRLTYTEVADILTSEKTAKFMAEQLVELKNQKEQLEKKIEDLEKQRNRAVFSKVEIPLIRFDVVAFLFYLVEQHAIIILTDRAADDLAETSRRQQVEVFDNLVIAPVNLHVKGLRVFRIMRHKDGFVVHDRDNCLIRPAEVLSPLKLGREFCVFGIVFNLDLQLGKLSPYFHNLSGDLLFLPLLNASRPLFLQVFYFLFQLFFLIL